MECLVSSSVCVALVSRFLVSPVRLVVVATASFIDAISSGRTTPTSVGIEAVLVGAIVC